MHRLIKICTLADCQGGWPRVEKESSSDSFFSLSTPHSRHRAVEAVLDMPDFSNFFPLKQHLHHIEPVRDRRTVEQPKIIRGSSNDCPPFSGIDRSRRARPTFTRPCFHFYKDQTFAIPKDQIQFSAAPREICCEI